MRKGTVPTVQDGRQAQCSCILLSQCSITIPMALGCGSTDVFPFLLRQSSRDTNMLLPLFPTDLPDFAALLPTTHTAPSSSSNCSSSFGIAVTAKGSEQLRTLHHGDPVPSGINRRFVSTL